MWRLGSGGGGGESYPERLSEPDCIYYLRTGVCGYGSRCRFHHPRNRAPVINSLISTRSVFFCTVLCGGFDKVTSFLSVSYVPYQMHYSSIYDLISLTQNLWFKFAWKLLIWCSAFILLGFGRSQNNRSWRVPRENGAARVSGIYFDHCWLRINQCTFMLLNVGI